jgi:hypothetical protein
MSSTVYINFKVMPKIMTNMTGKSDARVTIPKPSAPPAASVFVLGYQ